MALTVTQSFVHAQNFLKVESGYASTEEVRIANSVQSIIVNFYRWHWLISAATNISLTQSTQDYTMAAGDQNDVLGIQNAYLTDASSTYGELQAYSDRIHPVTAVEDRPTTVCLLSPTQIRVWPNPDATYTFIWRKYSRPTVFTANSESWDIPDAFNDVVKEGMIWRLAEYRDDSRDAKAREDFYRMLTQRRDDEMRTMGRIRI